MAVPISLSKKEKASSSSLQWNRLVFLFVSLLAWKKYSMLATLMTTTGEEKDDTMANPTIRISRSLRERVENGIYDNNNPPDADNATIRRKVQLQLPPPNADGRKQEPKPLPRDVVVDHNKNLPLSSASYPPPCTPKDQHRDKPEGLDEEQYNKVRDGEKIAAYLATELHKVGVPVVLLFGTALHEYRNGTGSNCVQPYFYEDDFDIGVFREHFHHVVSLLDDVDKRFVGWKGHATYSKEWKNTFLSIMPEGQGGKKGFQVDVYAIEVDEPRNGLINFSWDNMRVAKDSFLPLVKHKPVVTTTTMDAVNESTPFFYMPFNTHCFLANLYGEHFMTPQKGKKAGKGDEEGNHYNKPSCARELNDHEVVELERQMSFLNTSYAGVVDRVYKLRRTKERRKRN